MIRFFRRVKHILVWIPVLWYDCDWDYSDLMTIVQFKLRRMADSIEENDLVVDASLYAKEMRKAAEEFDKHKEPDKYYERPDDLPEWDPFSEGEYIPCPPKTAEWYKFLAEKEDEHWSMAWNLIRDRGRGWWD